MFARIRMCAFNGAQRVIKHRFSTGVDGPPKSSVQKAMAFLKRNRQQLINIFAVYLVLAFGVHNFKVQKKWEEYQIESKKLKLENDALKSKLVDKEWVESLEKKVRASKPAQNVLLAEIAEKITSIISEATTSDSVTTDENPFTISEVISSSVASPDNSLKGEKGPAGVQARASDTGRVI